jgi:sec-independent protein translocase protein TatC
VAVTDERPDPSSGAFDHEEPTMKPPEDKATGTMTLFEHLAELRVRILIVVLAVAAGTLIAWFFYDSAISFMLRPYHEFLLHHKAKDISHGNLVTNGPLEGFTTRLKVSVYGGIALA